MELNELTGLVVDLCIKIHNKIGPGCFEKVYDEILYYELIKRGIKVERQLLFPITWEDLKINNAYKLDLLVDNKLVLEIKSTISLSPVYYSQVRTYLSLLNMKYGMLINFHVDLMKHGIHRVYNNYGNEEFKN